MSLFNHIIVLLFWGRVHDVTLKETNKEQKTVFNFGHL